MLCCAVLASSAHLNIVSHIRGAVVASTISSHVCGQGGWRVVVVVVMVELSITELIARPAVAAGCREVRAADRMPTLVRNSPPAKHSARPRQ